MAGFDNDGYDEIFLNNIGELNKLFKILEEGNSSRFKLLKGLNRVVWVLEQLLQILITMEFLNY